MIAVAVVVLPHLMAIVVKLKWLIGSNPIPAIKFEARAKEVCVFYLV